LSRPKIVEIKGLLRPGVPEDDDAQLIALTGLKLDARE
jgi:hypothetical protein